MIIPTHEQILNHLLLNLELLTYAVPFEQRTLAGSVRNSFCTWRGFDVSHVYAVP